MVDNYQERQVLAVERRHHLFSTIDVVLNTTLDKFFRGQSDIFCTEIPTSVTMYGKVRVEFALTLEGFRNRCWLRPPSSSHLQTQSSQASGHYHRWTV